MVHMPGHIYYRIGRYLDSLTVNKDATAADEKYLAESNAPMGVYRLGYYPHNVHFVLVSAQMAGDGVTAIAAAQKLAGLIPDDQLLKSPGLQHIKAAMYFAHAQFSTPETILALPDPGSSAAYVASMWHYARGIAHAQRGDLASAATEASAIGSIAQSAGLKPLTDAGIPAQDILKLAREIVEGRTAQAKGDHEAAIARFRDAAVIQDGLRYTEPPFWYYPVRQSLAAALLQAGRLDEARDEFQRALKRAPNNGWTYFGLAELYRARGDTKSLQEAEAQLAKTWVGDTSLLNVSRL
jgi:tetratricopeptide (TPR) repeat protein